ncbi:MAG: hypothetical protein UZ21_OP11001000148 [Microgenomates bacterium OLB22]|nr:MAG: hypothetical protein UZ21_OP11001000148 [Microgenomates bacterium OLB22]
MMSISFFFLGVLFSYFEPVTMTKLLATLLLTIIGSSLHVAFIGRLSLVAVASISILIGLLSFSFINLVGFISGVALFICIYYVVHLSRSDKSRHDTI